MDDSMLLATWWGVGIAAAVGISGLIVGVFGLVQSRRARGLAEDATKIAREANALSAAANELAADANSVAKTSLARQNEHHVAEWRRNWANAGFYRLTNLGPDTVQSVTVEVTVDGESKSGEVKILHRDEYLLVEFPKARDAYYAENAAVAREQSFRAEAARRYPEAVANDPEPVLDLRNHNHRITGRVRWQTDAGTVREETWDDELQPLI